MNVELVNPTWVLGLSASSDAAKPKSRQRRVRAWARQVRARLGETPRCRRALHELRQLNDRELEDLILARAGFSPLAWRQASGLDPLART